MITADNSAAAFAQVERKQDAILNRIGIAGLVNIKRRTPVRTGVLQGNNNWEMTGPGEGRWYNDTLYSVPVEIGHTTASGSYVQGQHYMQRGLDDTTRQVDEIIREEADA